MLALTLQASCSVQQERGATAETIPVEVTAGSTVEVAEQESRSEALNRRLDMLLAENLTESDYQETSDCLYRHKYRHVSALGDSYLLFSKGDEYWVNHLKNRCIMLNRRMMLTFISNTQSLCAGDSVYISDRADLDRGFDSSGRPAVMLGSCVLGEFESINEAQATSLEAVLKEAVK